MLKVAQDVVMKDSTDFVCQSWDQLPLNLFRCLCRLLGLIPKKVPLKVEN